MIDGRSMNADLERLFDVNSGKVVFSLPMPALPQMMPIVRVPWWRRLWIRVGHWVGRLRGWAE